MKRYSLPFFLIFLTFAVGARADELLVQFVDQEIVGDGALDEVGFVSQEIRDMFYATNVDSVRAVLTQFPSEKVVNGVLLTMPNFANYHVVRLSAPLDDVLADMLRENPKVSSVIHNEIVFTMLYDCEHPDDPAYNGDLAPPQWYLGSDDAGVNCGINVVPAWSIVCNANPYTSPKVALFDQQAAEISLGDVAELEFERYDDIYPPEHHGTGVYSIIAARSNNGILMAGVGRNVEGKSYSVLPPISKIPRFGDMIYDAVDVWGCDVISSSAALAGVPEEYMPEVHKLLQYAFLSGVPIVVAGGQVSLEGPAEDTLPYPARYDLEVIAVSATDIYNGDWSGWSHFAKEVDLAAPGEYIVALDADGNWLGWPGAGFGGTSASQPLVAGTITLMQALVPDLLAEDYEGVLEGFAVDIDTVGFDVHTGWGRLNAGRAVANLIGNYGIEHGIATGAESTAVSTFIANLIGFEGMRELQPYFLKQYKHTMLVTWETAYTDSVWCWGTHDGGSGYRKPHGGDTRLPSRFVFPVRMSYRVDSDTDGATFETYAYEVYEDDEYQNLVMTIGEPNSANVEIRYGVVGKRSTNIPRFENRSLETGLAYSGQPYSAVAIDYHNWVSQQRDYEDIFVTTGQYGAVLSRCVVINDNGVPGFLDETTEAFSTVPPQDLAGTCQADYDNDGNMDLFVAGGLQQSARLYRNEGNGTFSDQSTLLGLSANREKVFAGAWADYDGDGWVDLYLCRGNGPGGAPEPDLLFRNDFGSTGAFLDVTDSEGISAGSANMTNAIAAVWVDVNGDGQTDLFVADCQVSGSPPDPTIHSRLFINDPQQIGSFTEEASTRFPDLIDDLRLVTAVDAADIDLDGDADLVAGSAVVAQGTEIFVNNGSGYFYQQDAIKLAGINSTSGARFFDHDLDGRPDLIVTSGDLITPPRMYRNKESEGGEPGFFDITALVFQGNAGSYAEGVVSLDWNRDGDQDLYLGRPTYHAHFYRAIQEDGGDIPSQSVVALKLSSPDGVNNAAAVGANVAVSSGMQYLVKRVDGGSSRGGQNDLVLTFPVAQSSGTVPVTVNWPNGWQQSAQVPVHIPGNAPYLLVDDTNPTVIYDTVSASTEYDPIDDEMTFVFDWQTEYGFDASLDKVTLDLSQVPPQCQPSVSEITPATPGAEHTYIRLSTGNYRHTLRWTGWDCEPNCTLPYTVTSAHRPGLSSTSATKQLRIRFCPTSF